MMKKFAQRTRAAFGAIVVGGLIGLLAAAAALGVAELVAGFTGIAGEPVIAVGGAAIDLTPIPVKDFAIVHFGSHDKTVLLTGIYVTLALFAMVTGILARRRIGYGLAGLGLFAVLGVAAVLTRPVSSPVHAVPTVVGVIVGALVMALLVRAARAPAGQRGETSFPRRNPPWSRPAPPPRPAARPVVVRIAGHLDTVVPAAAFLAVPPTAGDSSLPRPGRPPSRWPEPGPARPCCPGSMCPRRGLTSPFPPPRSPGRGRRAARSSTSRGSAHSPRPTGASTGLTPRSACPRSRRRPGTCGCTAWSSASWTSPSTSS